MHIPFIFALLLTTWASAVLSVELIGQAAIIDGDTLDAMLARPIEGFHFAGLGPEAIRTASYCKAS